MSYRTDARWTKKFRVGEERIRDNPRIGRKVSKITKTAEATIQILINSYVRYTIRELA